MNWNSHEFIWLDWTILAVGIVAVIWAVWRSVQKDKRSQQGASSEDYLFGKGEPWYIIGAAIFAANIGSEHLVSLAASWLISPFVLSTQLWSNPLPNFICSFSKLVTSGAMVLGVLKSNGVSVTAIISPVVMNVLSTGVMLSAFT